MTARVLTIAGSDPTGGAGLELDLRVLQVLGLHGCAVATALTVQDTTAVHEVVPIDAALVEKRLRVLLSDVVPTAIKVGMLATGAVAEVVADVLGDHRSTPVVVDPVVTSSSGARLLDDAGVDVLRRRILPLALIGTPNATEARLLLGASRDVAVEELARAFPTGWAVVTGGDVEGDEARDVVFGGDRVEVLSSPRVAGVSPHGTGCAFSTAIAGGLAAGRDVPEAIRLAKEFVGAAIRRAGGRRLLEF